MTDQGINLIKDDGVQVFTQIFSEMVDGQILDIATGPGGFIGVLKKYLKSYQKITGIDVRQELLVKAREAHPENSIAFEQMDASQMSFPDESFDMVTCAFSLHHLIDILPVLDEIKRVLKPDGIVIFVEMYKDGQTPAQLTEVAIHHFAAEIDMQLGTNHNHTFERHEIIAMLENQFLMIDTHDFAELTQDPKDAEMREEIEKIIDVVTERAKDLEDYPKYQQQAEEIKLRLAEIGTHPASRLVVVAKA